MEIEVIIDDEIMHRIDDEEAVLTFYMDDLEVTLTMDELRNLLVGKYA